MKTAIYKTRKIRERKYNINTNINAKIKNLQVKLVELSFTRESNSERYAQILDRIKRLRLVAQQK